MQIQYKFNRFPYVHNRKSNIKSVDFNTFSIDNSIRNQIHSVLLFCINRTHISFRKTECVYCLRALVRNAVVFSIGCVRCFENPCVLYCLRALFRKFKRSNDCDFLYYFPLRPSPANPPTIQTHIFTTAFSKS